MVFFSNFQYGFRSSRSTANLLTIVSDRIASAFNRPEATQAVALDISKAFDRVWHAGLLHKLKSYGISSQIFGLLFSVKDNFEWFWMESLHKNIQLMQEFLKAPLLVLHFSNINDLPDDVIYIIAIYSDDTTLYSKCDRESDLWQQLKLASELKSDLQDTVDWGKKWLIDFNAGNTQLVLFDRSNNNGSIDVKIDGPILEKKSSFKILG